MYSDLPSKYWEYNGYLVEYIRVLKVFWSPVPLSDTHSSYLYGKKSLLLKMKTMLETR